MIPASLPVRVLIVDDIKDAADSLARVVQLWGFEVHVAYDGPTGLLTALTYRPQILLLDFGLPEMDGFALMTELRARPDLRHIAVVSTSACNDDDFLLRLRSHGVHEHFPKPINLIALKKVIKDPAKLARSSSFRSALRSKSRVMELVEVGSDSF